MGVESGNNHTYCKSFLHINSYNIVDLIESFCSVYGNIKNKQTNVMYINIETLLEKTKKNENNFTYSK